MSPHRPIVDGNPANEVTADAGPIEPAVERLRALASLYNERAEVYSRLSAKMTELAAQATKDADEIGDLLRRANARATTNTDPEHSPESLPNESLPAKEEFDKLSDMELSKEQLRRRGTAIARAKALKSGDKRLIAFANSKWGSAANYADQKGSSAPSMSEYLTGKREVPRALAKMVEKDIGLPATTETWPKGIVD